MVEAACSHPQVPAAREEAAMAAAGLEEVGMEVETAGEVKEVVTAAARLEDEEAVDRKAVAEAEETGQAAEVMVVELTEAAVVAMGAAAMATGATAAVMAEAGNVCAASACGGYEDGADDGDGAGDGNDRSYNSSRRNRTRTLPYLNGSILTSVGRERDFQYAPWWRRRAGRPRIRNGQETGLPFLRAAIQTRRD